MRTTPFLTLIAFASISAGCASRPPVYAAPPRLSLPTAVTTPCRLDLLPEAPTVGDLRASYALRGEALVICDGARDLAVQTLIAERALQDRWREQTEPKRRSWWPF